MRKLLALTLATAALTVAACQTPSIGPAPGSRPAPSPTEFRPADFAWSRVAGGNRIEGRLAYRQGAATYTCSAVALMPETAYTARRMQILYQSTTAAATPAPIVQARPAPTPPPEFNSYVRQSACTAQGRYSFTGLPDGAWYVITRARPASGKGDQIAIMKRVVTRGGRTIVLDL